VATAVLFPALVGLGVWQLERAEEKRALVAQWQAAAEDAPQPLAQAVADGNPARFAPVTARGRYDAGHQLLLDNRIHGNRPGFQVLTPLRLEGADRAVLVNRGWVPMGASRRDLPALPTPAGPVRIRGALVAPPENGIRLGAADAGRGEWPKVVQYVVPERVADQLGYPVMDRVVRLAPEAEGGFVRDWGEAPPVPFGPERHVGYAVQWFALAATLVAIFVAVNLRRKGRADDDGNG
jgi:surfeit locus 1 family protein